MVDMELKGLMHLWVWYTTKVAPGYLRAVGLDDMAIEMENIGEVGAVDKAFDVLGDLGRRVGEWSGTVGKATPGHVDAVAAISVSLQLRNTLIEKVKEGVLESSVESVVAQLLGGIVKRAPDTITWPTTGRSDN